jgi:hypothetical protein
MVRHGVITVTLLPTELAHAILMAANAGLRHGPDRLVPSEVFLLGSRPNLGPRSLVTVMRHHTGPVVVGSSILNVKYCTTNCSRVTERRELNIFGLCDGDTSILWPS